MNISGIYYFDRRPLRETDSAQALLAVRGKSGGRAQRIATAPGLLMVQTGPEGDSKVRGKLSNDAVAWDGRLDNRQELLERYRGFLEDSSSDGEVALTAYAVDGPHGLRSLIGDWSLAICDAQKREIVLASDYAGVRPLYYARDSHRVVWASSLEGVREWTGITELDEEFVREFLVRSPSVRRTPYRGIEAVPCGHFVRISARHAMGGEFWSLPIGESVSYADGAEYAQRYRELFEAAVAARLRTSGPACTELSGGLDSSSVTCMADRLVRGGSVQAPGITTFSYDHPGSPDSRFIEIVERARNQESIHLDTRSYGFVAADSTGEAAPLFWGPRLREIRRHMRELGSDVLMTGQMGDVVMGNWWDDSEQVGDDVRSGRFARAAMNALAWSRAVHAPVYSILLRAVQANLPWRAGDIGFPNFHPDDSLEPAFKRRAGAVDCNMEARWLRDVSPGQRKSYWAVQEMRETHLLRCPEPLQEISCTHPYADRPLVEYMLTIPAAMVCKPGVPRALMRTGLRGLLPEAVRTRRSKAPYDGVFLASLRPLAMRMLRGVRQMRLVQHGFVDPRSVENRLQKLVQHLECNEPQLRRVILLEYWLQNRERTGALRGSDGVTADEPVFHARLAMSAAFECR
jgi:asparagine synthase (glutamine-hydrolysing)